MKRKAIAATGLVALVLLGLHGGAVAQVETGHEPEPGDPVATVSDLVDGMDFVNRGTGSVEPSGPRGTSWSSLVGVRLTVGDDIDLRLLDTLVASTTDHDRVGAPQNFSRGEASVAAVYVRDTIRDVHGGPAHVPDRFEGESFNGENQQKYCLDPMPTACVGEQVVLFPEADIPLAGIRWDDAHEHTAGVIGLAEAVAEETGARQDEDGNLVVPLPTGDQPLVVGTGSLITGLLHPAGIDTRMTPEGGLAEIDSSVKSLVMLDGLTAMQNGGPGSQTARVSGDLAEAETRTLKIEQMTLLQTDALLRLLGLNSDQLPDETLAQLADALGLHTGDFVATVAGARNWDTVAEMQEGLHALQDAVVNAFGTGASCDLIDELIRGEYGFDPYEVAEQYGIDRPDCLGLTGALDHFVAAVNQLQVDLHDALVKSVGEEAVVSVADVQAGVSARATVAGRPLAGAGLSGGIHRLRVTGLEQELNVQDNADAWNENEEILNTELNGFLEVLGPEFHDVVRIRLMPSVTQAGRIVDGKYLQAEAAMALLKVYVNPPSRDAVERAARDLADTGSGGGGGAEGSLLGRAGVGDPIIITVGEMAAMAEHTNGSDLPLPPGCQDPDGDCDAGHLLTTTWDVERGWGPGGPGTGTNLPRTGGSSGTLPIGVAAGLSVGAYAMRRFLGRPGRPAPGETT